MASDESDVKPCTRCGLRTGHAPDCDVGLGIAPSDDAIRSVWRQAGGSFHGPNVEHGMMAEADLLPFLRGWMLSPALVPTEKES